MNPETERSPNFVIVLSLPHRTTGPAWPRCAATVPRPSAPPSPARPSTTPSTPASTRRRLCNSPIPPWPCPVLAPNSLRWIRTSFSSRGRSADSAGLVRGRVPGEGSASSPSLVESVMEMRRTYFLLIFLWWKKDATKCVQIDFLKFNISTIIALIVNSSSESVIFSCSITFHK